VFQRLLPERPYPQAVREAYCLQRTRLESIAERKGFARRQLTEDGNLEIRGGLRQLPIADVRRASPKPPQSTQAV
jgi:hypothetical protein